VETPAQIPIPHQAPAEQRVGSLGVVMLAVLAGIAAYFVSALANIRP
jgi:hypothetical protein